MAERAADDRGLPIAALHPRDVRAAAQGPDPSRAALALHLTNSIKAESRRWTPRSVVLGLILIVGFFAIQAFGRRAGLTQYPYVRPLLTIGGLAAIVLIARADTRRRVGSQLAATAVAEGLCGGCCYSLRALPGEPDGCIVCPECGAAWQTRRITRPYWLTPGAPRSRAEGGRAGTGANWLIRFITLTPPPQQLLGPDDRGRFVSIVDSRLYLIPRSRRSELGPDRLRSARRALRRVRRTPRVLLAFAPLSIAALCGYAAANSLGDRDPSMGVAMLLAFAFFALVASALLLSHAFYSPRLAARVMVAQSLCPSCARPLDGLPIDADACAVCPECGASWRPPTIAR